MRRLLDTSCWIWLSTGSRQLSASTRARLEQAQHVMVSLVTPWETAIAYAVRRLRAVLPA
jgi:PIN domain nuclease of toxin-antitoxin system